MKFPRLFKKGQGLSLNVIIVAALALIVLVVLIAVFTGRISIFQEQIGGEAKSELQAMQALYGTCHPGTLSETTFLADYSTAANSDDLNDAAQGKAAAKDTLRSEMSRCKNIGDKGSCESDGCAWS